MESQVQTQVQNKPSVDIVLSNGRTVAVRRDKAIKYYKLVTYMAENFSKDPSTKVGALFMYPGTLQILSMGYNGMPRSVDEKKPERWERPLKYRFTEHAERNGIYNAAQSGTTLRDSICVASMFPCADCARGIIQSGCKMVVSLNLEQSGDEERLARWKSDWDISMAMFREAGVELVFLDKRELI